jgi:transposase
MKENIKKEDKKESVKKKQPAETRKTLKMRVQELLGKMKVSASWKLLDIKNQLAFSIGIDIGDKKSRYCILDFQGEIVVEDLLATTEEEFSAYFSSIPKTCIALEVGTHSPWISALLESLAHIVYVANPRKMESIHKNRRKNDKVDARTLARLVRADPELLYPIRHRGIEAREDLVVLRAREALVSERTSLINSMRGFVKSIGRRLPKCSADSFHNSVAESIPERLEPTLRPMLEQIESLTNKIKKYDTQVERMAVKKYPDTEMLRQVKGVGALTSLAYMLTLENPDRFEKSREVGPYLGLVPRQDESGDSSPQLRITKTGDKMVRRLLVSSAQYILGPFGDDCDLRRYGEKIAARGGKNAKKRAVVAVARKLAVLLHRLWKTGEAYEPLYNSKRIEESLPTAGEAFGDCQRPISVENSAMNNM